MTDCLTADGGVISFRRDVTEQKLIEHELSKRRKLIDDLSELTYDWFWREDARGQVHRVFGSGRTARAASQATN